MSVGYLSSEVYSLSAYKESLHSPNVLLNCKHKELTGDPAHVHTHIHNTDEGCGTECCMGYAKHTHLHLHYILEGDTLFIRSTNDTLPLHKLHVSLHLKLDILPFKSSLGNSHYFLCNPFLRSTIDIHILTATTGKVT